MVSIKLFAGTHIGRRDNNEDNFTVCPDLNIGEWMVPANQQEIIPLGQQGSLMVVADGMGGMNAGEVASDIAIKTVHQMFSPSALSANVIEKPESVKSYLKSVIIQADLNIKQYTQKDHSTEGMGSTIVIAWLYKTDVFIAWLGDSRAYSFVPGKGISRLSKDHSYVQQLIDAEMISEEEALIHPQSNVITRSLGDMSQNANPDVICHAIQAGEIILLCSDGLCGVCTDAEISERIEQNYQDLQKCKEVLTNAALVAGGSDNITVALMQIVEADIVSRTKQQTFLLNKNAIFIAGIALAFIVILMTFWFSMRKKSTIRVSSIKLELSKSEIQTGDTISFRVTVNPEGAQPDYTLYCDNDMLTIDMVNNIIFCNRNPNQKVSTEIQCVYSADSLIRDTVKINLQPKKMMSSDTTGSMDKQKGISGGIKLKVETSSSDSTSTNDSAPQPVENAREVNSGIYELDKLKN